jgi:Ca2+-transporting ATPase
VEKLGSDAEKGLSYREVELRKKKYGENKLPEKKPLSKLRIFLSQFTNPFIYILVVAGIVTVFLKEYTDAVVIFAAVLLNAIVGFFQENKASQALKELKRAVKYKAEVLREGNLKIIDSTELVPGDIIILNPGDKVSADGRLLEANDLKVNEVALTGEWLSADKKEGVLPEETPLADRDNMVYMGCVVEDGKGKAVVTATGLSTEIGQVALIVKEEKEEKTPYQKKLAKFSRTVGIVIGIICLGIFIEGMVAGREFVEMFTTAVAVAVSSIPESLPVAMTVILALGMQRILKKKGLVRRLASAETLGSTSVIATDKTATLTEGKMKVGEVVAYPSGLLPDKVERGEGYLALKAGALISEAFIENPDEPREKWIIRGRPTDRALLEAGIGIGIVDDLKNLKKTGELPFNPINKLSAASYEEDGKNFLYVCGAPEKILEICLLDSKKKKELEGELQKIAQKGLRVIASSYKTLPIKNPDDFRIEDEIRDLIFTGFITLKDPIRPEVKEAMKTCRRAGITPIIVTGDHKLTAKAVAEELGFKIKSGNILEGKELDKMSDEEFRKKLDKIKIYARVEPKHKMRIVQAWQARGEVVAMTGDGINDAPAIKKADIGVAIGSGTEVAKETSDLILLNDSFSIIVVAIEEGRAIIDNIRKVVTYLLSDSFTEVILIGSSVLGGFPLPVSAVQILWVNLMSDSLPGVALAFEPKEKDLMNRKPQGHNVPLLTQEMRLIIFIIGILTDFLLLGLFFWLWRQNHDITYVRTMIFSCLTIDSLFYIFSCKSLKKNLWNTNPFSNRFLIFSWLFGIVGLLAALYLPVFQSLLKTVPLGLSDWLILISLGLIEIILIEVAKHYFIVRHKTD